MQVLVFCRRPGSLRAGRPHPSFRAYPADFFTAKQLQELIADPVFTVVAGTELTAENVPDFVEQHATPDSDGERSAEAGEGKSASANPAKLRAGRKAS